MKQHLIVVEGEYDQAFLTEYLIFLDIQDHFRIQTTAGNKKNTGGNGKLSSFLKQLADPYESLSIIFDADESYSKTHNGIIQQINKRLNTEPLESFLKEILTAVINKNSIFLFPDNSSSGTLEHLLLTCPKSPQFFDCIDQYYQCLKHNEVKGKEHKIKYFSYLAAMGHYKKQENQYQERFDFNNSCLNPLKQFIESILK